MSWAAWAGAIATFLAVLVALRLHIAIFPPKLGVRLVSRDGVATPVTITTMKDNVVLSARTERGRYYHVDLVNERYRWAVAANAAVHIIAVELEDASGKQFIEAWTGAVPIVATYFGVHPDKTLGASPHRYDLCSVVKEKWVELHPQILTQDFPHRHRVEDAPIRLRVILQARSLESVSRPFAFELSWDGKWDEDATRMRQHMVVTSA